MSVSTINQQCIFLFLLDREHDSCGAPEPTTQRMLLLVQLLLVGNGLGL